MPSGPGAGSEKRCVLGATEICRVNYLWAWDMPVYQAFSEIIALIISWSTLRTDSISQTEPEGMACKQSPFEDSGGVVSTTVDDGLT